MQTTFQIGTRILLASAFLVGISACAADDAGPATPGSPSAEAATEAAQIAAEAKELEALARALTSEMDGARERVVSGTVPLDDEAAALQAKMAELSARHDALQARIQAWEDGLHTSAGDGAWPQEPVKGKR